MPPPKLKTPGKMSTAKQCMQCESIFYGRGVKFCGNSCKMTFRNLIDNPAKNPDTAHKISVAAIARNAQALMMTKAARRKAVQNIKGKLKGRTLTSDHKSAISRGTKLAGCRPPWADHHPSGPDHPQWKGGVSLVRNKDWGTPQYQNFRFAVFNRDKHTCQKCKYHGPKLHAHHIKAWAEYPELRYDPSNGITLCHDCHHAEHRGKPRPKGCQPRTLAALRLSLAAVA
jgi:5-methylcytosine-specific restriction endonuclease McrA